MIRFAEPDGFAEFGVATNFSFLRGASHPEELVAQAIALGLAAIGIADRNSLAGIVRAHLFLRHNADQANGLRVVSGARLVFCDGTPDILAYPRDRAAYARLCRLLTTGNIRSRKGGCQLRLADLIAWNEGLQLIALAASTFEPDADAKAAGRHFADYAETDVVPEDAGDHAAVPAGNVPGLFSPFAHDLHSILPGTRQAAARPRTKPASAARSGVARSETPPDKRSSLEQLAAACPDRLWLGVTMIYGATMRGDLAKRRKLADRLGLPLIATNDVVMHDPARRELQDVITCIRHGVTLETAGRKLAANAERHLKPPAEMRRLFIEAPEAVSETLRFLDGLTFSLDELGNDYPEELREGYATPQDALAAFARDGAARRYPSGVPDHVTPPSPTSSRSWRRWTTRRTS